MRFKHGAGGVGCGCDTCFACALPPPYARILFNDLGLLIVCGSASAGCIRPPSRIDPRPYVVLYPPPISFGSRPEFMEISPVIAHVAHESQPSAEGCVHHRCCSFVHRRSDVFGRVPARAQVLWRPFWRRCGCGFRVSRNTVTLARDIALFMVAFSTTKREAELTATLIQRILRLPNGNGLMFNFQRGKTQRGGADHLLARPYDGVPTCLFGRSEQSNNW